MILATIDVQRWITENPAKYFRTQLEEKLALAEAAYRRATPENFQKLQGTLDGLTAAMVLFDSMVDVIRDYNERLTNAS